METKIKPEHIEKIQKVLDSERRAEVIVKKENDEVVILKVSKQKV